MYLMMQAAPHAPILGLAFAFEALLVLFVKICALFALGEVALPDRLDELEVSTPSLPDHLLARWCILLAT